MRKFNVKKSIAGISAAALIFTAGAVLPSYTGVKFTSSLTVCAASYGDSIVSAAKSDVGKSRGSVGCGGSGDWCALYATTKAKNAGVNLDYCKEPTYCSELVYDFINKGIYHSKAKTTHSGSRTGRTVDCSKAYDGNYIPKPGDFIFYDWQAANSTELSEPQPDHVGIVEYVSNGVVYTIEGNRGGSSTVDRKSCSLNSKLIHGYASFGGTQTSNTTYLAGDLNLDGKVDVTDCTCLSLYLLGDTTLASIAGNESATRKNADVNGDGKINLVDLATLKGIVAKVGNTGEQIVDPYIKRLPANTPIYADAGSSTIKDRIRDAGTFTIVKEKTVNGVKYGYLKSGAGWVKL